MRAVAQQNEAAKVIDLTPSTTAAPDDELRRRAADGDQRALAELNRRRAESEPWARAA